MTLSCVRWIGAFFMLLPFAWPHLRADWPALRGRLPLMVVLSATGFAFNNALSYWALQYTQALNALMIQSSGPLFVALWSLLLFGVRLTLAQFAGIALSLAGVLTILLHGDLAALASIEFNRGDLMFASARAGVRAVFGADAAAAGDAPIVADRLHHRLRRAAAAAVLGLGILDRLYPEIRRADARHARLCGDLSLDARLSVLQPRHRADRPQPRRAVLPSGAGVRLGDGDRAARRTAAGCFT